MTNEFLARRDTAIAIKLKEDMSLDLCGDAAIFRLIHGVDMEAAEKALHFTADWFEHPHPHGRDHRGEADFAALRMINALYRCYDKVSAECQASLENFFLHRDYSSIFGSENHAIMYRVARLLAAQFYNDRYFEQYNMNAAEVIAEDSKYIDEFLMYRARRAWGEFDSGCYAADIMYILHMLYMYTEDERLKKKAAMSMDLILLDMIADSKKGIYGGAHARIYEGNSLNSCVCGMYDYYCYYFGAYPDYPQTNMSQSAALLSDYYPSEIVFKVEKNRSLPYENKERKHLHLCDAWVGDIDYELLEKVEGLSIDKSIYICEDYMLGGINHQDKYPEDVQCGWYAHHQQHEWELTLPGNGRAKIFSHHPGKPNYHNSHNHWTGDIHCCCGTHFCTKDTAISMYNIVKEEECPYINADIPLEFFDERLLEKQYIFLKHRKLGIMVWFSNDYRFVSEDLTTCFEAVSDGRKHAFICHVEPLEKYGSLEAFAEAMKKLPIEFDSNTMTVKFNGILMDYKDRWVNGEKQIFPYEKLYDSPWLCSDYCSGIIYVTDGTDSEVYDFNF
ncbi:MAG: hypothetical protein IKD04_09345 [Clostridia bacterium]|nr:hypothetical protein [Clostridia bacterium]